MYNAPLYKPNQIITDLTPYPTLNQGESFDTTSDKYSLIPTTRVITVLDNLGWKPVQIAEMRCNNKDRLGFQKHLIKFQNNMLVMGDGKHIPEIVLTNSHDGKASFKLIAGIFRLVCSNGLIVADSTLMSHNIRHIGYTDQAVRLAVESICDSVPQVASKIHDFNEIELTQNEQGVYTMAALTAKYGEEEVSKRDFVTDNLLYSYRSDDKAPTLWNTFNKVQENFIKGGRFERKAPKASSWRSRPRLGKTRGTTAIKENVRINQALWTLTEKMAEIKTGDKKELIAA